MGPVKQEAFLSDCVRACLNREQKQLDVCLARLYSQIATRLWWILLWQQKSLENNIVTLKEDPLLVFCANLPYFKVHSDFAPSVI